MDWTREQVISVFCDAQNNLASVWQRQSDWSSNKQKWVTSLRTEQISFQRFSETEQLRISSVFKIKHCADSLHQLSHSYDIWMYVRVDSAVVFTYTVRRGRQSSTLQQGKGQKKVIGQLNEHGTTTQKEQTVTCNPINSHWNQRAKAKKD